MIQNKKIIFFDGDGTVWYPKKTKRKIAPHWIYSDKEISGNYLNHLVLIPSVFAVLKKLKKSGYILILISTHPQIKKEADILLSEKVRHLKLEDVFDEFFTSRDYPEGKGELIKKILKKRKLPKSQALLIGDSYRYDYLSAKKAGIDAVLIKSEYMKHPARGRKISRTVTGIEDLLS